MDHRDHIESPSVERRKLLEKRMEMIASLVYQMNEEDSPKKESETENKRTRIIDCNGIWILNRLGQCVTMLQRMFT